MSELAPVFTAMGRILALCPSCEELFYLSEAHPYLAGKQPKSIVDRLRAQVRKLDEIEEKLFEVEAEMRRIAAEKGRRATKASLKKIDPTFSGSGYDPQDVKVIFHPISYVLFHGLSSEGVNKIVLLDEAATDSATERLHRSIDNVIERGDIDFKTLRVHEDGHITAE